MKYPQFEMSQTMTKLTRGTLEKTITVERWCCELSWVFHLENEMMVNIMNMIIWIVVVV